MEDEYMCHWTTLRSTIDLLLVNPENLTSPTHKISFEETYSAVYKCVCSHKVNTGTLRKVVGFNRITDTYTRKELYFQTLIRL